jgi:hypothetical protein
MHVTVMRSFSGLAAMDGQTQTGVQDITAELLGDSFDVFGISLY